MDGKKERGQEMVHFVGAGPGAVDLITVRGAELIRSADQIIYAGSLVNPDLLKMCGPECRVYDSARMTLEEVIVRIREAENEGKTTVRLHTGDPCIYGAIREQMDELERLGIAYDICPGVSSFCGAAASLGLEYTLPGVSQSVVITRMAGRTPVPERESIASFAAHRATMVIFLSAGLADRLQEELIKGGYGEDTPAAVIYKASWPDEKKIFCTVGTLAASAAAGQIDRMALFVIGDAAGTGRYERSKLYHPAFTTGYREGKEDEQREV